MRSQLSRHLKRLAALVVLLGTTSVLVSTTGVLANTTGLPLGLSTACGCEAGGGGGEEEIEKGTKVAWKAKKNNVVVNECNFRVENKPCEIIMEVKGNGEGVTVEKHEEKGANWNKRYTLMAEGCKKGTTYKPVSNCTDEITVKAPPEAGTENEYCTALEKENKGAPKPVLTFCFKLKE
jgi:hypothetical protein